MSSRKPKAPVKSTKNQYLQVYVRCRPLNDSEHNQRSTSVVDIHGTKDISVQDRCNSKIMKTYSFDRVFTPLSSQAEIYQTVVAPLVSDVLAGYNCTVFAYGQTGSGKTFTMEGDLNASSPQVFSRDSQAGLIPRAMCSLFDELRVLQSEYTVRISFIELYNEELYDLLSPDDVPPKLRLFEDPVKKGSVVVHGLQEVMVHTQVQVLDELRKGCAKRQVAATLMNAQSSRSHTIFSVTVHFKENSVDGEELMRTGKLNLVDLAGSENIGRSGSVDKRAREAANINQSLLTLSRVTACLVEHQPHVPYRESKLTRLLQDSLGGRTKTSLIATISLANLNVEETLSSLDYAHRAKSVSNKPEVNQKVSQTVIMKEYTELIDDLKKKIDLHRNGAGVYVNDENYKQLVNQTKENNDKIYEILSEIRAVQGHKKSIEDTCKDLSAHLESQKINLVNLNNTVAKTNEEIDVAQDVLVKHSTEQEEAKMLLGALSNKENELRSQADHLSNVVDKAHSDCEKIHNRLDFSRVVLVENAVVLNRLKEKANFSLQASEKMYSSLTTGKAILSKLLLTFESLDESLKKESTVIRNSVQKFLANLSKGTDTFKAVAASTMEHRKASILNSQGNLASSSLMIQNLIKGVEEDLHDLCVEYHNLISQLPLKTTSFIDFIGQCNRNMKETTHQQFTKHKEKLDIVSIDSEKRVDNLTIMLRSLERTKKVPLDSLLKHIELVKEKKSAVKSLCNQSKEEFDAQAVKLIECKQERVKESCSVKEYAASVVEYFKEQESVVVLSCNDAKNASADSLENFKTGLNTLSTKLMETVAENERVEMKMKEVGNGLLSYDFTTVPKQSLKDIRAVISDHAATLESEVTSVNNLVKDSQELYETARSTLQEMHEKQQGYEHNEDEALGIFLDSVQSACSEVLEHLDTGRKVISDILTTEISKDKSTGQTPVRKSYGPIPKLAKLPSPVLDKAKERVKRAPWKRLLRSPRKPLISSMSLHDVEDECMASDSELSVSLKKETSFHSLQKASSLSDLRSNKVFHRPRIPKKFARKAL